MKWGRIGLALLTALQLQVAAAQNNKRGNNNVRSNPGDSVDTGLFPIDTAPSANGFSVDDLFPTQPRIGINPPQSGNGNNGANGGNGNNNGVGNNNGNNNNNNNNNNNGNGSGVPVVIRDSGVKDDFKCNLFTNSEYSDILSAANLLNQAVGSPSCTGNTISAQQVVDNNKKITDAIATLQPYLDKPETVQQENIPQIVSTVDSAIRAANSLATTFANTDLMNKTCRDQMNGGQVALAINDMINGLTPYALMAASMTGGTAAIPFIVGGTVITSAISSMEKIINDNSTKIKDPSVRRAVVENTCQFIRLDQKYKFLQKNRDEQILKISTEMSTTSNLMSAKLTGVSNATTDLMNRKNAMSQTSMALESSLNTAGLQLALDKQFVQSTTDDVKICQLGIQLAQMSDEKSSYVATMLGSVDQAMVVYGTTDVPQARALKASGQIAVRSLKKMATLQFNFNSDFTPCSRATKSLVETIDQSGTLSRQMLNLAQSNLDKELKASPEYAQIQSRLSLLKQKQQQAARITNSLDNLRKYATNFNQSEIDAEMDRLRAGLFGTRTLGISSPVMAWFNNARELHTGAMNKFKAGIQSLRSRAYRMTKSGSTVSTYYGPAVSPDQLAADSKAANNLETLTLAGMTRGSAVYSDTCREMNDVWNRWVVAVDHLSAIESFCQMINNYVYDNRSEDAALVQMCRGRQAYVGVGNTQSDLGAMKAAIVNEKTNVWATLIKKRIDALGCPSMGAL